jgi:hypothetical protein
MVGRSAVWVLYGQVSKIVVRKKYYCLADRKNSFDRHEQTG